MIENGKVFIARRLLRDSSGGKWEFPGGKVELGESSTQALKRELMEELGIEIRVEKLFSTNRFKTEKVEFHIELFKCERTKGDIQLFEHSEYKWVHAHELKSFDMLSGDLPFIEEILKTKP
jgi:8-oxo-dGTP diphosphatase